MPSDLNLASPNTEVTLTIGPAFSTTAEIVAEEASISTSGVVLSIENTPVPVAPSTILVDEAQDISVEISNPSTTNVIEIAPADLPEIFVDAIEVPSIVVYDSTSLVFNLVDLDDIVGDPQDGDIIIYDGDTNTFIFDQPPAQGGVFSTEVQVTNNDLALGDALGMTYAEGASIQGAIKDIFSPVKPSVYDYDLEINQGDADTSNYVFKGALFRLGSLRLYFDRYENLIPGSTVSVYHNDILISQSDVISSPKPSISIPQSSFISWSASGDVDYFVVRVVYNSDGQYYEKRLPIYRVEPIGLFLTNMSDEQLIETGAAEAVGFLSMLDGKDYDGGHTRSERSAVLSGSVNSEDSRYHTVLAVPVDYTIDTITEVTGGFGTADMTDSFYKISDMPFKMYPSVPGVDEFDVYLYRSNQTGALKEKSSLRVKVL